MKIGVVADTHSQKIPQQLMEALKHVDLIIHAGDFCSWRDYQHFAQLNTVKAVFGNMDDEEVRQKLPRKEILTIEACRIGITHGDGSSKTILDYIQKEFENDRIDAIIFGHSHQPMNEVINGVLYFNPGSPNDTIFAPYFSYGVLDVHSGNIKGKIIKVRNNHG